MRQLSKAEAYNKEFAARTTQSSRPIIRRGVSDADLLAEIGALTFSATFAADNTTEDMKP